MNYERKINYAANSYYNVGLEQARVRDLSGASTSLKRCLRMNKYHTDARNLLGLIYYEMGEVGNALVQWVISLNLQPDDNLADHFLDEVQRKPGNLEVAGQTIKKYNMALLYAQNDNGDLAILQLSRVVGENPHFVKAHLLLALLYMEREDYTKAGKSLYKVLRIDKNNAKAQYYMSIVKSKTGREEIEKRKLKQAFSHRKMEDDDVIIPPTYKETTGWQTIINIIVGLCLGAAVVFFLVMPPKTRAINVAHNQEMLQFHQQLSDSNNEKTRLEAEADDMSEQVTQLQDQLNAIGDSQSQLIVQYDNLLTALNMYRKEELTKAAELYTALDVALVQADEVFMSVYNELNADMVESGTPLLMLRGQEAVAAGDDNTALDYYNKCMVLKPSDPELWYEIGMIYQRKDDKDSANEWFGRIVREFPDSETAVKAQTARGY